MALYQLEILSSLPTFVGTYYNTLTESQKADVATALQRPMGWVSLYDNNDKFYHRWWSISGVMYTAVTVVNSYAQIFRIIPDGVTTSIQSFDYIDITDNPWTGIYLSEGLPNSSYTHRTGYSYYEIVDGRPFDSAGVFPIYNSVEDIISEADSMFSGVRYPITYSYTNSVVTGPSEASVGETVIVSAVPNVGYGITDATTQISVTNNDIAVPYTWDAATNRITFTMPDPT